MYNGQRVLGFLFILMMANFYTVLPLTVFYWKFISSLIAPVFFTSSQVLTVWWILYFAGLIVWVFNAVQAYYKSIQTRDGSFDGIDNRLLPPLCSFLIPGWGQFLNGQPKKGSCLLLFALAGHFVLSISLVFLLLWPVLDTEKDRLLLEAALAFAIVLSPLIFLMWGFSVYDALRVCLDSVKKEPIHKRFGYAVNRMRIKGWKLGVVPRLKVTFMLSLFLVLCLTVSYYYFPQRDYLVHLRNFQSQLSNQKMVLIPKLIDKLLRWTLPHTTAHRGNNRS
jgi:hypothetical protein